MAGWAAALQSDRLTGEQRARALAAITRSVALQGRVVEDLVDLSRVAHGRLTLQEGPVDLGPIVEATCEALARDAASRGVALRVALARDLPRVIGDSARLQQVVSNLVTNALKHSDRGGTVSVQLEGRDGGARIVVRDEGCGIEPELLPHVFDRYWQGRGGGEGGGLGLGLSIVRVLVELHRGQVEAHSDGAGHGATFTVWLPRAPSSRLTPTDPRGIR
jgi:signal transduction histidine kinase